MKIIVGKTAGFCFGVKRAVDNTLEELKKENKVYCLGELVHNLQVTKELLNKGVIFIDNIEDAKGKTIIRAHGVPKETYQKANEMGIEIKDLTCPKVLQIHKIAEKYKDNNCFIFLIGKKDHPETIGTISFCGENSMVIESEKDIEKALEKYKQSDLIEALLIAQTTFSVEKYMKIANLLKERIPSIKIINTICNATKENQIETERISNIVDRMIVIGGKNSSNSNKIFEIAKKNCKQTVFIETKEELDINNISKDDTIGVMAGASTPQKSIEEVIDILNKIC